MTRTLMQRLRYRVSAITTSLMIRVIKFTWLNNSNKERYNLLLLLESARQQFRCHPPSYFLYETWLKQQLSRYLHEPHERVNTIVRRFRVVKTLNEQRKCRHWSGEAIEQYMNSYCGDDFARHEAIRDLPCGPRILVCYHFADYLNALRYICRFTDPERQFMVIRYTRSTTIRRPKSSSLENWLPRANVEVIDSLDVNAARVIAFLRRTNATLITFCDVPIEHGVAAKVKFLGRLAWFPKGPALISLVARVPILQMISVRSGSVNQVQLQWLDRCEPALQETLDQAANRITQTLIDTLQCYLVRYPEQWLYLSRLPSYFSDRQGKGNTG